MPPPTSTTTAFWSPNAISIWSPEGATPRLVGLTLVGVDGDTADTLVAEAGARPVDDGLRAVLVGRQQGEMDRPPGNLRLDALHRPAADHLHNRGAPTDR